MCEEKPSHHLRHHHWSATGSLRQPCLRGMGTYWQEQERSQLDLPLPGFLTLSPSQSCRNPPEGGGGLLGRAPESMRSQDISGAGKKRLFGVFRQKGALRHRKPLPSQRSRLVPPPADQLGATVMVSKALTSWNLSQKKLTSSCLVPSLLGRISKCICELCWALKGGTLRERSKGTGQFWSRPSAGLEKHREAPKGLEGRAGAALTLPARGPPLGTPGSPSLGAVYPPGWQGQEAGESQAEGGQGCPGSVKGRGGWIHTDAGGTWGRPDAKAQLPTCT